MAASKSASGAKNKGDAAAAKNQGSPPAAGSSHIHKKSTSPMFKKLTSPVPVKDSRCADVMFKIFKSCDGKSHVCSFHLQKGQTDGFSKPINDAIRSGELANDGFVFANSAVHVSRESDKPKLTFKGFHCRCFPQFIGDSEIPDTLEGCLANCDKLKAILTAPANNTRFNASYRVSADDNLTQNPHRSADVLIASTIVNIIDCKHAVEQGKTFYKMVPELAGICFTPNPTHPDKAISELGHPAGDIAHQAANKDSDEDSDDD
jgi:hypothetical protein